MHFSFKIFKNWFEKKGGKRKVKNAYTSSLVEENYGEFDHFKWVISQLNNLDTAESKMSSVHEFAHSEINFTTVYGQLLKFYSFLAKDDWECSIKCQRIFIQLCKCSERTHEVYATWIGIIACYGLHDRKITAEDVLANFPEYLEFYNLARSFVNDLRSSMLQEIIITAIIRFCFQSKAVGLAVLLNPTDFLISSVSGIETPNGRFNHILNNFPAPYFSNKIREYVDVEHDLQKKTFLQNELAGKGYLNRTSYVLGDKEVDEVCKHLIHFIYQDLRQYFDCKGSLSYDNNEHLPYSDLFISRIKMLYPESRIDNFFLPNLDPQNVSRHIFTRFERERIKFNKERLKCRLYFPSKMTNTKKNEILRTLEKHALVLHSRHTNLLIAQYEFENLHDKDWLTNANKGLTFLRATIEDNQDSIVVIIPFDELIEFYNFIYKSNINNKKIGYISFSAMMDSHWRSSPWVEFYDYGIDQFYWLNDISLLYSLEKAQRMGNSEKYVYGRASLESFGFNVSAFIVEIYEFGKANVMILPCSIAAYEFISKYIGEHYSNFTEDHSYFNIHSENVNEILAHIITEEYEWFLAVDAVSDYLFKNS